MCLTCNCRQPNEDHGDSRNLTLDDLKAAADAAKLSGGPQEAFKNMKECMASGAVYQESVRRLLQQPVSAGKRNKDGKTALRSLPKSKAVGSVDQSPTSSGGY